MSDDFLLKLNDLIDNTKIQNLDRFMSQYRRESRRKNASISNTKLLNFIYDVNKHFPKMIHCVYPPQSNKDINMKRVILQYNHTWIFPLFQTEMQQTTIKPQSVIRNIESSRKYFETNLYKKTNPKIVMYMPNGVLEDIQNLLDYLEVPIIKNEQELYKYIRDAQEHNAKRPLNTDLSLLSALVSDYSHGISDTPENIPRTLLNSAFTSSKLYKDGTEMNKLLNIIDGREIILCKYLYKLFNKIVNVFGNEREKERYRKLLLSNRFKIVPDRIHFRITNKFMKTGELLAPMVFSTGYHYDAITVSSYVRFTNKLNRHNIEVDIEPIKQCLLRSNNEIYSKPDLRIFGMRVK